MGHEDEPLPRKAAERAEAAVMNITASAPGSATLVYRYWRAVGGVFVEDEAQQRLTAVRIVGASHADIAFGTDGSDNLTVCRPVICTFVSPMAASAAQPRLLGAGCGGRRMHLDPEPEGRVVGSYEHPDPLEDHHENEPAGPSVSATFSEKTIIFEDAYENAPGQWVARRLTADTEVTYYVYGGTNGGNYAFSLQDGERLSRQSGSFVPRSGSIKAGESFQIKVKYEAVAASGAVGDISALATFTEAGTGQVISSYCPPPWSAGTIDWVVPLAWGVPDAESISDKVDTIGTIYHQLFTFNADGGIRIDKFTQWIHCSVDGAITHSEGIR